MQKKKLALCVELTEENIEELLEYCEVVPAGYYKRKKKNITENELLDDCLSSELVIVGYENVSGKCIDVLVESGMKIIGCTRSTPVNIDWKAVHYHNIPLIYTPGRNAVSVAEFTIGLMIALSRHIARAYSDLKLGRHLAPPVDDIFIVPQKEDVVWRPNGQRVLDSYGFGIELMGSVIGIVGYGAIGTKLGQIAKAIGMEVIAHDPYVLPETMEKDGVKAASLEYLVKNSDFVSIHLPVTPETVGIIDESLFLLMKPKAYFVNTSRASVVDQRAFIETMKNKRIAGAAIDVSWQEPMPSNHPVLEMDNVIITPHIGGLTVEVNKKWTSQLITQEILRYCRNEPVRNLWTRVE